MKELNLDLFARCLAGDLSGATALAREIVRLSPEQRQNDARWKFMAETFGLPDPRQPEAADAPTPLPAG